MSKKSSLDATFQKNPCTLHQKVYVFPESPHSSCDNKETKNNDPCYECQLNSKERLKELEFITLDSPRSPLQEQEGKSDQDLLREFKVLKECHVLLSPCDRLKEVSVTSEKLKKSVVNHYTRSVPYKHFKVHYGNNYVNDLAAMGCENILEREEVNYEELYKKHITSGFHSLKFSQFRKLAQKTFRVYQNCLDSRHKKSELIKKKEDELKQKQRIYYENHSYVLVNKEDVSKIKQCQVKLGPKCENLCPISICKSITEEEARKKDRQKIYYFKNYYVYVPKGADGDACKEAIAKQCKVVILNNHRTSLGKDSRNISSNSDLSSHDLCNTAQIEVSLEERTRFNSCSRNLSLVPDCIYDVCESSGEESSQNTENISPSPDSMPRILSSNKEIIDPKINSIRPGLPTRSHKSILCKEAGQKAQIFYTEDSAKFKEAIENKIHCCVVLNKLVNGVDANLTQKLIVEKEVKNGQKKRKGCESKLIPISRRFTDSNCKKDADSGQKSSVKCYKKLKIAVQDSCNVALDSNIKELQFQGRSEDTVHPIAVVDQSSHQDISSFANENDPHCLSSHSNEEEQIILHPPNELLHQNVLSFTNSNENALDCLSSQSNKGEQIINLQLNTNQSITNTEHNSQNIESDQDSLSSTTSNSSSSCSTTFSGILASDLSDHDDADQNSLEFILNDDNTGVLSSSKHENHFQSSNEAMSPQSHQSITESSSVNSSPEIHPQSSSQENFGTNLTIQSSQNSFNSSQELFEESSPQCDILESCDTFQNSQIMTASPNSSLPTINTDSQEHFVENPEIVTPLTFSGSLKSCDSTQNCIESTASDPLTTAHVTNASASPNPYASTPNLTALPDKIRRDSLDVGSSSELPSQHNTPELKLGSENLHFLNCSKSYIHMEPKLRTNGRLQNITSMDKKDFSESCRVSGSQYVTNGVCNGENSDTDSNHSSSDSTDIGSNWSDTRSDKQQTYSTHNDR